NKVRGGGVLTAITASLGSCSHRYDLELCSECVWVEVPTVDGINMLIGNHYFNPDTKPEVITAYFRQLENNLDTNNARIILLGDFNAPGFNWENGTPLSSCHYYSKLKGDSIYTSTCFLGLRQCVEAVDTANMLDLVFANFTDLKSVPADSGLVATDIYHPPLNIDVLLPNVNSNLKCEFSYQNFAAGNYALLYNILSTYDWSSVYETSSVDVAVASLSVAVRSAMEQAIPCGYRYKSKYPHWFSYTLRYYITKKNYFHCRFKKNPSDYFYDRFTYHRKLVKNTIKSDRLRWLKSVFLLLLLLSLPPVVCLRQYIICRNYSTVSTTNISVLYLDLYFTAYTDPFRCNASY
ncbi:hypothetical protein B7P43_G05118, partial [Cryptotermes secundus]